MKIQKAATECTEFTDNDIRNKTILFAAICAAVVVANISILRQLLEFSLRNGFASHILLIPFVSVALILRNRTAVFSSNRFCVILGASISILAIALLIFPGISDEYRLSLKTAAFVTLLLGIFLSIFGLESFRKALFPLLFLFLMIPIPEYLLQPTVAFLQKGSAEMCAILFRLTGTPFLREGTVFALPGTNIDIAPQCSGIRSSLALFITCLLAGHLMLETGWKKLVFLLASIPMAMFKNAVRIVCLSLLAIHVDMRWLTSSRLHSEGGVLFFLLGFALLLPLLWLLGRSEPKTKSSH